MQILLLLALAVALVAMMFALQNIVPVTVAFLAWTFEGSLALVLFVALVAGALVAFLASLPTILKRRLTATSLRKRIAALEADLDGCKRRLEAAHAGSSPATGASRRTDPQLGTPAL